jgi:hypothetical protein
MTIAKMLNIVDFPFEIRDKQNRIIYYENSDGYWSKNIYCGNLLVYENSNGDIFVKSSTGETYTATKSNLTIPKP